MFIRSESEIDSAFVELNSHYGAQCQIVNRILLDIALTGPNRMIVNGDEARKWPGSLGTIELDNRMLINSFGSRAHSILSLTKRYNSLE